MDRRVEYPTIATKVLPVTANLCSSAACCPTRDLVALGSTVASDSKLNLWRVTGEVESVWAWSAAGTGKATPAKGKGKEVPSGQIEAVAWNPQGTYVAVAVHAPTKSTVTLVSVQNGLSPIPSISLPNQAHISHLSWQPLQPSFDSSLSSFASSLIKELPRLPTLTPAASAVAAAAPPGGPGSGVFGSMKNAMLLREREKEAGRALEMEVAAKNFPGLLSMENVGESSPSESSLLLAGDDVGNVHLYLEGSVYLGSISVAEGQTVVGATVLSSNSSTPRISVLLSNLLPSAFNLSSRTFFLPLPPSLNILAQQSSLLRNSIDHAFVALQEVRLLWDESRRIGKVWLTRLSELGKANDVSAPAVTQLLMLLMTGRASVSMHDFLASKMNERAVTKWETTTVTALEKLKAVTFQSVTPAIEQVILLLEEVKAWANWPEQFDSFKLDSDWVDRSLETCKQIIRRTTKLERLALEEEACFSAFSHWLHYELDKVSLQEGSEIRPHARFQPIPVAHYIRHCLPSSPITSFLNFGLAQTSLELNTDLRDAELWYASLKPESPAELSTEEETFENMVKRMNEELKGQASAAVLEGASKKRNEWQAPTSDSMERPQRSRTPSGTGSPEVPESLVALLHLLAGKMGQGLNDAIKRVREAVEVDECIALGQADARENRPFVRERSVGEGPESALLTAWISEQSLCISRVFSDGIRHNATASLVTPGAVLEVVDFDFFDDVELVFAIKRTINSRPTYDLGTVTLSQLNFSPAGAIQFNTIKALPLARVHDLGSQFPPQSLALNGRPGRRVAVVLAGEGRRIEVLDLDGASEEGEEGVGQGGDAVMEDA